MAHAQCAWKAALRSGLDRWCSEIGIHSVNGVEVQRLRQRCPLVILSGATPGPFYHSHPHVPAEFDHLQFDMSSQVRANIQTIRKIGNSVADANLPFPFSGSMDFCRSPQLLHWISDNGDGFAKNASTCADVTTEACMEEGMDNASVLATIQTGDNVSDRRFLLETFAIFGMEGESDRQQSKGSTLQIDIKAEFDPKYFMPYVPAYVVSGPSDLALFSVTAASGETTGPMSGSEQVEAVIGKLLQVLNGLGATFEDVVLCWNRVSHLDEDEEAVLMTRSRMGLHRPLAESVLEVVESDSNGLATDGTPLQLEYIIVAQVPRPT
mmetsp:Transcript_96239/g.311990  ORF Transcript_96239/g.311990 Transcript_96239/m.311990 type:complete len:323 (-) Transcript_96239:123-1091(-)